jgi:hypothetical protein
VFVSGYRHEAAIVRKQVRLGRYELGRDGTVRGQYAYYDAIRTPGPASIQETAVPHNEMLLPNAEHVPYYDSGCVPGNFRLSVAANAVEHVGSWAFTKGVLSVRVGVLVDVWELEDLRSRAFTLRAMRSEAPDGGAGIYSEAVGYGYAVTKTPFLSSPLDWSDFQPLGQYEGFAQSWDPSRPIGGGARTATESRWTYYPATWRASGAWKAHGRRDVVANLNYPCADGYRVAGHPIGCFDDVLLNYEADKSIFYTNDGHDYSGDGCFNDGGHPKTWVALVEGGKVSKALFIEFTDISGTYLAVGRWFSPDAK